VATPSVSVSVEPSEKKEGEEKGEKRKSVVVIENASTSSLKDSLSAPSSTGRAVIRIKSKKNLREAMAEGGTPLAEGSAPTADANKS
jgi:hypothetical protein